MRVTTSILYRNALSDLARLRTRMAATQEQASTGQRINRPSDDPSAAGRVHLLEGELRALEQFEQTIAATRARVAGSENAVANSVDLMLRVRELAVQGANGTLDLTARSQLAEEVEGLHASLLAESNARLGGGHLFAGYLSDVAPFTVAGAFGAPPAVPTVSYVGDSNEIQVDIEDGVQVSASFDGRRIFLGDGDGDGLPDAGREDAFAVIADLRTALALDDQVAVAATLPRIDAVLDQLQAARTEMGIVESRLDAAEDRVLARGDQLTRNLSILRDADLAEVVSNLTRDETALQASLALMGRLLPPSLMDFLR